MLGLGQVSGSGMVSMLGFRLGHLFGLGLGFRLGLGFVLGVRVRFKFHYLIRNPSTAHYDSFSSSPEAPKTKPSQWKSRDL